ncbi:MAG: hypothetical protein SVR04_02055 [Spirochaetota bacterium]|nr:hypothetical protein [Spirochaetota bacterium]
MKRSSFKHFIAVFAGAALLSGALLLVLLLSACGIPQYPYLYPPEAFSETNRVGFDHVASNDPNVFRGYEIYYKFYINTNPDDNNTVVKKDIDLFNFNSTIAFSSISYNSGGSATYLNGFRKLLVDISEISVDLVPQISIDILERSLEIKKEDSQSKITLTLSNYLGSEYECYRIVDNESINYKTFFPIDDDTTYLSQRDTDLLHLGSFDFDSDTLYIAFFAVTYGLDDGSPIFSNYSSDGMVYIGSFEFN